MNLHHKEGNSLDLNIQRVVRKQPPPVRAVRVTDGGVAAKVGCWIAGHVTITMDRETPVFSVKTTYGELTFEIGDWVIAGEFGVCWILSNMEFERDYEYVEKQSADLQSL